MQESLAVHKDSIAIAAAKASGSAGRAVGQDRARLAQAADGAGTGESGALHVA